MPLVSDGTLIEARDALAAYPKLPGVNLPKGPSRMPRYDYGSDFDHRGIQTVFPPRPIEGQEYPIRVPRTDADGNGVAGLRYPHVDVPLGTYNGWSLRKAGYAEGDQFWNTASFVPFARTRKERERAGDPRPSIEERYPSHVAYVEAVKRACELRVNDQLLLQEDADRFVQEAQKRNPLDQSVTLGPLVPVLVGPGG